MTLESRDTLCDANPPIFRRRPNYRPFRCLEEKDRANQAGDSSAMKLGVWPLEEVRRLGHETRIASKGAKMASFPDLYSTAFEKVPLSAPLCTQNLPHLARGATRWLSASQVLSSLFILCLSSRRSPTQGTRTKKAKGGRGEGSTKLQLLPARPDGMELEGAGPRRRRGQLQSKRGWSSQSWPNPGGTAPHYVALGRRGFDFE